MVVVGGGGVTVGSVTLGEGVNSRICGGSDELSSPSQQVHRSSLLTPQLLLRAPACARACLALICGGIVANVCWSLPQTLDMPPWCRCVRIAANPMTSVHCTVLC